MSDQKKLLPHVHAVMGDVQMPVVKATDQDVQYVSGFRGDLPFLHAVTEDGKAQVPVVKVLGAGDGPTPGGDSIEQGDGIKITTVGDKKVISTAVPISTSGPTGKHRHWRWDFPATLAEGSSFVRVDRIRATGSDNANIPLNGKSVTSSGSQSAYPASDVFRVDENSGWHWRSSGAAPAWIAIDVGAGNEVQMSSTRLFVATAAAGGRPASVHLSYSDDGVTWTKVGEADLTYEGTWSSSVLAGEGQVPLFIGEAPEDGKAYARKDGDWAEVAVSGELTVEAGVGIKVDTSVPGKATVSTLVPISKKGSAGKHRYWRWDILSSVDPASPRLRTHRIRAADEAGGNIVFAPETVSASSETTTDKASNLFRDGDTQVGWATQDPAPGWVSVDTGSNPVEIRSFFVQSLNSYSQAAPDEITLSFSDDGVNWTEVARAKLVYDATNKSQPVAVSSDQDVPAFIGDAPENGKAYNRKDGGWVEAEAGGAGLDIPSLPVAGAIEPGDMLPVSQSLNPPGEGWRIRALRSFASESLASTGAVYVYEIEFRASAGGSKHPNGTLLSGGVSSGGNAFDGNLGSNTSSTAGAAAVILGQSYGVAVKVNELAIYSPSVAKDKFPAVFHLERRTEASDAWEVVESFDLIAQGMSQADLPDNGWFTLDVSGSDAASLRKLTMERVAAYIQAGIPKLEVEAGDGIKVDTSVPNKAKVSTLIPISRKGPPGKHRFWRWTFPANYGDDQFRLQKLRMFDGAGQRIVLNATNTTVTSSNQDAGTPASNAIYNEATGHWATARFVSFPVWVATEFTTPLEITSVTLARNETLQNTRPRSIMVEFSDDGITWVQALEVTTLTWAGSDTAAVPMGDTDVPAFPPYPPKDGKVYAMRNDEWEETRNPKLITAGVGINVRDLGETVEISTKVPLSVRETVGAHKYWRWVFPTTTNIIYMDRIALFDETDTPIPVSINNATVTASSAHTGTYPENVFYDSENTGRWRTAAGGALPHWVQAEFNQKIDIAKFTMRVTTASSNTPYGVVLQYSDNGYFWVDAFENLNFGYSGGTAGPFLVGDTEKPAYITIPPKDGRLYGVRNGVAEEIPQLGQGGRTYGAFVNYTSKPIPTEKTGIEMEWGTAGIPPEGRIYRISCVLAIDGSLGAEVGISFSELQASMLRIKATYTAPDGSMGTRVITEPDGQLVVILGLEKTLIVLEGTMIDTTFHPVVLNMQVQLLSGDNASIMKGTLATLVDVGELTANP